MTNLSVFQFQPSFELRVIMIDDAPWFVAADVAAALDYRMASDMTRFLDDDEKGTQIVRTPSNDQEMTVINESGLYSAILKSRKPEAKKFKKWVTSEVLPTIRKTGRYELTPSAPIKREYVGNDDMNNLKRLVYALCCGIDHKSSLSHAIWYALRDVTGVPSPAKFEVDHLPVLAEELTRIYGVLNAYKTAKANTEKLLIKNIIRNREGHLLHLLMAEVQDSLNEINHHAQQNWGHTFGEGYRRFVTRQPNSYPHAEMAERLI